MVYAHLRYSDMPFMGSVTAPERAEDSVALAKLVFGDDFVENNAVMINLINANSPMTFDATMLGALKVYARHNQASIVTDRTSTRLSSSHYCAPRMPSSS